MALGLVGVHPHWYRWSSTMTGAAGCGRVNGHVRELQGIVAELVAKGDGSGRSEAMGRLVATLAHGCAPACADRGMGDSLLSFSLRFCDQGGYGQCQ